MNIDRRPQTSGFRLKASVINCLPSDIRLFKVFFLLFMGFGSMVCGLWSAVCLAEDSQTEAQESYEQWQKLRQEDPQAFFQQAQQRRQQIRERFQQMKQENPEQFEQFRQNAMQQRRAQFQRMKEENPEQFQQMMQNRMQRFQQMQQRNPERFQQMMQKHPGLSQKLQNFKGRSGVPGEAEGFQSGGPGGGMRAMPWAQKMTSQNTEGSSDGFNPQQMMEQKKQWLEQKHEGMQQDGFQGSDDFSNARFEKMQRMQQMAQQNPEQMQQMMEQKRRWLQQMQQENPEKFQQMMESHPGMREKFERMQQGGSQGGPRRGVPGAWMNQAGQEDEEESFEGFGGPGGRRRRF